MKILYYDYIFVVILTKYGQPTAHSFISALNTTIKTKSRIILLLIRSGNGIIDLESRFC